MSAAGKASDRGVAKATSQGAESAAGRAQAPISRPRLVIHMHDRRPIWAMPPWVVDDVRAALPAEWEIVVVETPADGSGDGTSGVSAEVLEAVRGATVYLGFGIPAEILRAGRELRWVHSGAAGVGSSLTPEMHASSVIFTNSAGIHGPPIAETVIGMILHFARGLDVAGAAQVDGRWAQEAFYGEDSPVREVADSTVGILGYGGIGREVGRRARALGARVLGFRRSSAATHAEGASDPAEPDVEILTGEDGFGRLLAESDYLVLAAPDTPETRGIMNGEAIGRMRRGAVLLNVGRGTLVEEEALVDALRDGRLRGAGLDVFREEPLPEGHPLWSLPNVLLTPHVSAVTRSFWPRQAELIVGNIHAFLEGEPLRNVVDRQAGY